MLTVFILYLPHRDAYVSVLDVAGGSVLFDPDMLQAATFPDFETAKRVQRWVIFNAGEKTCSIHPFDIYDMEERSLWHKS